MPGTPPSGCLDIRMNVKIVSNRVAHAGVDVTTRRKTPLRVVGVGVPPSTRDQRCRKMRGHMRDVDRESPAQPGLRAWSAKPSRKLQWFESTTRPTPSERPLTCVNAVRGRSPSSPTVTGRLRRATGICGQSTDKNAVMIIGLDLPRRRAWPPRCGGERSRPGSCQPVPQWLPPRPALRRAASRTHSHATREVSRPKGYFMPAASTDMTSSRRWRPTSCPNVSLT